jgi:hypothetical protein
MHAPPPKQRKSWPELFSGHFLLPRIARSPAWFHVFGKFLKQAPSYYLSPSLNIAALSLDVRRRTLTFEAGR